ncbi:thioredoxin family protein [Streptomyces sp. DSM 40712]|uniref:Thioredoxin family protein n=1 Tax=Streptomyces lancefieldiae TaxID=3075520 RepID=A0ABU3AKR9_9ACTN|nr:thioredoxin family protein [Streptomyces sp. DSM 40712]MDT0610533.1 thioredoxin family protein [Streptomyces sp. DSM 40712]
MPRWRRNGGTRVRGRSDGKRFDAAGTGLAAAGPRLDAAGRRLDSAGRRLGAGDLGAALGERATLVQFSTAFCAPCRATRRILAEVAGMVPGVAHVEIDAEHRLELVRALDVLKTPTVLVLDAGGRVVRRAVGLPRKADVIAALGEAV